MTKYSEYIVSEEDRKKITSWSKEQDAIVFEQQKKSTDPMIQQMVNMFDGAYYGAIGGQLTYSFTPTSIGTVFRVEHSNGAVLDLTDFDSW